MLSFSFHEYYFLLFPVALIVFYVLRQWQRQMAVGALVSISMAFLWAVDLRSLLLLSLCVSYNYGFIRATQHWRDQPEAAGYLRVGLVVGLLLNITPFIVYKLFSSNAESGLSVVISSNTLTPFGLAFYFLQQTSVLLDAHKGKTAHLSLLEYLLFSFCFITVPSGPIFTYRQASKQLPTWPKQTVPFNDIALGVSLFIFGLAKFCFIAEPIGQYTSLFLRTLQEMPELSLSFTEGLYTILGCLLQLYFTFSAYSDMAIGMGFCFGLRLPINFDSPLKATNLVEYINAWHMSFIAFLREYVFQPVFTLCKKLPIEDVKERYTAGWAIGVFFTFFITALWHSPSAFAVLQGFVIALILVLLELRNAKQKGKVSSAKQRVKTFFARTNTLLTVFVTGVLFYAPSIDVAKALFSSVVFPESITLDLRLAAIFGGFASEHVLFSSFFASVVHLPEEWLADVLFSPGWAVAHLVVVLFVVFFMPNSMQIFGLHESRFSSVMNIRWRMSFSSAVLMALLFILSIGLLSREAGITYA